MIHRFVDLLEDELLYPDIPILAFDQTPTFTRTLWQIGNGATPYRMTQPAVTSLSTPQIHLGDPQREPVTGNSIVYSKFTITGTISREIRLVDWADTTDILLYTESGGTNGYSLEPTWAPDGSQILFRGRDASNFPTRLKTMNPDGSGVTTIYSGSNQVFQPSYSYDGSKIAWGDGGAAIMVANPDGSSATAAYTGGGGEGVGAPAWQRGALVIGFRTTDGGFTSDEHWKVMNDDGTGLANWLTISRASGYGPGDADPSTIMYSWLADDSAIATTVRQLADPDPDSRLTLIDSGGSNLISPARYGASNAGSPDTRPAAITGFSEGINRIYWLEAVGAPISSILPDGSGYRVDFDGTGTSGGSIFHGFRGDTVNV